MKGQASVEYLVIFATTLAFLSVLAASLAAEATLLQERPDGLKATMKAEGAARALESMLNSGGRMQFDFRRENIYYNVEHGHFHARHEDKLIEIGGIFRDDRTEPV